MRLTLRTLLAYLDDILDPADAKVLGNKINESEFATALVHQIRGSVRRLRLDAPTLNAQGIGSELNSVAEYLDNVLPPDQVPALEKACLDDEVNLGEVASCHQILTLVLGEAAPVTDTMRRAAYGVAPTVPLQDSDGKQVYAHDAHPNVPPPTSTMIVGPAAYPPELTTPPAASAAPTSTPPDELETSRQRMITRIDAPSTKETWRAEASALEQEQATGGESSDAFSAAITSATAVGSTSAPADAPASSAKTTAPRTPAPEPYPDYMPRKSSWLRSAFITGIIALLILGGLLFATGNIQDNLLTRWLGTTEQVADHEGAKLSDSTPSTPTQARTSEPPESTSPDTEVNIVSPNLREPETVRDDAPSAPNLQADPDFLLGQNSDAVVSDEPARFESTSDPIAQSSESMPGGDLEAELIEPEPAEVLAPSNDTLNEDVAENDTSSADELVDLPSFDPSNDVILDETHRPEAATNSSETSTVLNDEIVPERENDPLAESSSITPGVGTENIIPAEVSTIEPATIEPPVAATPDVGDLAVVTRQPFDSSVPAIVEPDTVEPNVGRAQAISLQRDDQLFLLFDEASQTWHRVTSEVQLQENDHLLGMPAFRADIQMGDNLLCSVHGVARLRLGPGNDLTILDGRLVLKNMDAADVQGIRFRGQRYDVHLIDPGSSVAIEASHQYVPGADITGAQPHAILKIHPLDNSITVDQMGKTFDISKGRHLLALDDFEPSINKSPRTLKWMKADSLRIDKYTRDRWQKELQDISDVRGWLVNKAESNRAQQVSLAARCLAEMDDFSAIVAALGNQTQSGGQYWMEHFNTLRSALTRGTEVQNLIRTQFEQAYGKDQANLMMEMLRGYNDKQLASGSATMLVHQLENPLLEMRVLAIENLFDITGARSDYRAGASPTTRMGRTKAWQKRLQAGRIRYSEKPELVRLLETAVEDQDG